jgi:multidrug efflux system membrane fusion protein
MTVATEQPGLPPPSPANRRPHWRNARAIAIVIGIAVLLGVGLTFCARQSGPAAGGGGGGRAGSGSGGRPAVTVAISKATLGSIPIEFTALGTVTPLATVDVIPRVSGMLDKVAFSEGQMVRAGQLLVQIDPRPFEVALDQAQAQLLHDQALLVDARLDLTRYATLAKQDSIAGQTVDTQAALVKQDEATVKADEAAVANAHLNLSFAHITSPVSGRVGLRQIDAGNQITAYATTPIAVVTEVSPISVEFSLPEDNIPAVMRNARAGGHGLPVTVFDRDGGTAIAQGTLETLDNVIDTTTGTVKARAQFANTDGALFPSQFVNVTLLVNTLENQVIVPTTAVRHGPQGDFVWVMQPGQTVKNRPVKVGPGTPETVSIVSGLQAGETVITEGGDRLRDGAKVVLPGQHGGAGGKGGQHHHSHGGGAPGGGAPGGE